jgi:hypothetical protein
VIWLDKSAVIKQRLDQILDRLLCIDKRPDCKPTGRPVIDQRCPRRQDDRPIIDQRLDCKLAGCPCINKRLDCKLGDRLCINRHRYKRRYRWRCLLLFVKNQ